MTRLIGMTTGMNKMIGMTKNGGLMTRRKAINSNNDEITLFETAGRLVYPTYDGLI